MKRWPANKAWFWETAPFFRVLLPFAAGILAYELWPQIMTAIHGAVVAAGLLSVYLLLSLFTGKSRFAQGSAWYAMSVVLLLGGYTVSSLNDARNTRSWFGHTLGKGCTYLVRVTDLRSENEFSYKLPVAVIATIENGKITPVTGRALLYLSKDGPMLMNKGDTILVPDKWQSIKNAGNPFEFDYAGYCRRNNIFYRQTCSVNDVRLYATNDPEHVPWLDRTHTWCAAQLETYIPDQRTKNLVEAMLLGDEVNLDEDLRQAYADTGIVHIIAISGGNVSIFFVVIAFLLRWLHSRKYQWIKYLIALPLVWMYVVMAGAPPSAIRAAIMFSLLAFGVMMQKEQNALNQLFATGFLLLCAEPMWLFSVGFQLSFVAVLSLILFYPPVYAWYKSRYKVKRWLWSAVAASIAAEVLVAPLAVYYFHTFPLLFLVANVLAFVFMNVVLILAIIVVAAGILPEVDKYIGIVTSAIGSFFNRIVAWMQSLNPESLRYLKLSGPELVIVYVAIIAMTVFLLRRKKPALTVCLAACCLLVSSFCRNEWMTLHRRQLVVYNNSRASHTELIRGPSFAVLNTDTAQVRRIGYATGPAHIGWHSLRGEAYQSSEISSVHGKSVLVLSSASVSTGHFHVDYLVLNSLNRMDPAMLKEVFSPAVLVIGNTMHRKQRQAYIRDCRQAGLNVYDVAASGAFISD